MTAWLALFLLALQDAPAGDAEKLVKQLSHDEFSEREKADRTLRSIGEPARPVLEKAILTEEDPERRFRCQEILAAIEAALPVRRPLKVGWTVTIPEREYSLGEFPGLLKEQIPVVLQVPPALAESRVRLAIRNAGFFQFLDRLTEAHGGITFSAGDAPGTFRLVEGKPARAPVCYPGSLRIALDRLTLESWQRFGTTWRGASMVLDLTWQPDVAPIPADYLPYKLAHEVTDLEVYGDDGKQIQGIAAHHDPGFAYARDKMQPSGWRIRARIPDPPPSMKRLSLIKGKVQMIFPTRIEMIEFKKPVAEVMDSKDLGIFTVKYSNCRRTESGVTLGLSFSRPASAAGKDERINLASRYAEGFMRMVGIDGKEYPLHFMLGSQEFDSRRELRRFSGYFDVPGEVASLKVPLIVNYYVSAVEFEFRDVELP